MSEPSRILIVDDSLLARMMARQSINKFLPTAKIVEAIDGTDALKKADTDEFEIAFIDLNMPGMDGLAVALELKQRNSKTHLILCTANIQETSRQRADALGMKFLAKPISLDKVKEVLQNWD